MIQTFTIQGQLPGMNEIIASSKDTRFAYNALKKEHGMAILVAIQNQKLKPMPYAYVTCHWIEQDTRRDPDNICAGIKFLLDNLVYKNILPGDGWVHVLGIAHKFSVDKGEPRVEVTLNTKVEA